MQITTASKSLLACLLACALVVTAGCKKPPVVGACVVAFEGFGPKGGACAVVNEIECKDDMSPAAVSYASSKRQAFTPAKTCEDVGYSKGGCADVPLLWSFKDRCPR